VILGYGNLTPGEIEEGERRIKTVLDKSVSSRDAI
jgi:hypothetical protein